MRVLITGAHGFVGRNLTLRLEEEGEFDIDAFGRQDDRDTLPDRIAQADRIVHLAGSNRPTNDEEFEEINHGLTARIAQVVARSGRAIPLLFSSTTHAEGDTAYGHSKRQGEQAVADLSAMSDNPCIIYRYPNIFGKWSKPNYNSVVATFCYNAARGLPLRVDNPTTDLTLVYIDDVVEGIIAWLRSEKHPAGLEWGTVRTSYQTTVGELARQISAFASVRESHTVEDVGVGLSRALYATYISFLPTDAFSYPLTKHSDKRGTFAEMLRTQRSGQISFFTAHAGVTRGGHYHHSKTEKFLVVTGRARFKFRHMLTGECHELVTDASKLEIVDTIPGWSHDISNIGDGEMVVMLWANELFDPDRPDTIANMP